MLTGDLLNCFVMVSLREKSAARQPSPAQHRSYIYGRKQQARPLLLLNQWVPALQTYGDGLQLNYLCDDAISFVAMKISTYYQ